MALNGALDALRLDANVTLSHTRRTVLKEPLNKRDIVTAIFVDFSRVPLAETVSTDAFIPQPITNKSELFLNGSFRNRKDDVVGANAVPQAVVLNILTNQKRNCEDALFLSLLLSNLEAVLFIQTVTEECLVDLQKVIDVRRLSA